MVASRRRADLDRPVPPAARSIGRSEAHKLCGEERGGPEAALREMDALGFNIRHRRHRRLLEAYRRFAGMKLRECGLPRPR